MTSRTLIAIPTTDRDVAHIAACHDALLASVRTVQAARPGAAFEVLVMTRTTDTGTIAAWSSLRDGGNGLPIAIETFAPYAIEERHNMQAIALKRNFAMARARGDAFDHVLFVDSDIIVGPGTIAGLLARMTPGVDVTLAAYAVKWLGHPAVGVLKGDHFEILHLSDAALNAPRVVHVIGMGCTLIGRSCFHVPFEERKIFDRDNVFDEGPEAGVRGEDIGFSLRCLAEGKVLFYTGEVVEHR